MRNRRRLEDLVLIAVVTLSVVAGMVALRVMDPSWLRLGREQAFDFYHQMAPRELGAARVVIVDIDDESLARFGIWPWPRSLMAELVARIGKAGIAVGPAILFAEPDRYAPAVIAERVPQLTAGQLRAMPDPDRHFADTIGTFQTVLGAVGTVGLHSSEGAPAWPSTISPPSQQLPPIRQFLGAIRALPVLERQAAGVGLLNAVPDRDGVTRQALILAWVDDQLVPSFELELLRVALGVDADAMTVAPDGRGGAILSLGELALPVDRNGMVRPHFADHSTLLTVSAADVLSGAVDDATFQGRLVLIGPTAAGLGDRAATPLARNVAGVTVRAQILEALISGGVLMAADNTPWPTLAILVLAAIIVATAAVWGGVLASILAAAIIIALLGGGSWLAFTNAGVLFDPVTPAAGAVVVCLALLLVQAEREAGRRRYAMAAFSRYVAPSLVEQITTNPSALRLGGEARDVSVLIVELGGVTTLAEQMPPEQLILNVNRLLAQLGTIVQVHNGTVNQYLADHFLAVWNAPAVDFDHQRHALAAAREIDWWVRTRLGPESADFDADFPLRRLRVQVGVARGVCAIGNIGSLGHMSYSVIGDAINIAARLAFLARAYGVTSALSETVIGPDREEDILEVDRVLIKGKATPVSVWTFAGADDLDPDMALPDWSACHAQMLASYRNQDWINAKARLDTCRKALAGRRFDYLYDLYAERIAAYEAAQPPDDWEGSVLYAVQK